MQHYERATIQSMNPMQNLMELNLRTLESLSFMSPMDFTHMNHPEMLLERNMETFVSNGHKLLDYMHQVLLMGESHMFSTSQQFERSTKNAMNRSQTKTMHTTGNSTKTSHKTSQKMHGTPTTTKNTIKKSKTPSLSTSTRSSSRMGIPLSKGSSISSKAKRAH